MNAREGQGPKRMRLKPATEGLVVRDPRTMQPLPAEGLEVVLDVFWRRRLADGDVVEVKDPPARAPRARQVDVAAERREG